MAARRMMLPDYGTVSMKGTQYYRTRVTDQQGRRVSLYARTREELYQKEQEAIQQIPLYWHYHVGVVYLYLYRYLWPYDRDLPCNFGGSRSNGCHDGQGMGRYGTELPPIPAGAGFSGVSHYCLRGNLCCAGAEHRSGR